MGPLLKRIGAVLAVILTLAVFGGSGATAQAVDEIRCDSSEIAVQIDGRFECRRIVSLFQTDDVVRGNSCSIMCSEGSMGIGCPDGQGCGCTCVNGTPECVCEDIP